MMKRQGPSRWKDYELKVTEALSRTWPGAVAHDQRIEGRSGGKVQVDTLLHLPEGVEFVIVDAKDWKKRVGRPAIDQLFGAVEETGAKTGAIVSNSGFAQTAVEAARRRGLEVFSLVDTLDAKVRCALFLDSVTQFVWVEKMRPSFSLFGDSYSIECSPTEIGAGDGQTVFELFAERWNAGALARDDGGHEETLASFMMLSAPSAGLVMKPTDDVLFSYSVTSKRYQALLPITSAYGIYDVKTELFHSLGEELGFEVSLERIVAEGEEVVLGEPTPAGVQLMGHAVHMLGEELTAPEGV